MTPLNERIARLLEPVPKARGEHSDGRGYSFVTEGGCYVRYSPDSTPVLLSSFDPEHSIDCSMRVIEAKWPGADVEIKTPKPHYEFFLASLCHMPTEDRPSLLAQEVSKESASEALALALCAALEAEVGK